MNDIYMGDKHMIALLSNGITSEALKNALSKHIATLSSAAVVVCAPQV